MNAPRKNRALEGFLEALYPSRARCMGCGELSGTERPWLCETCMAEIVRLDLSGMPRCRRCGRPLEPGEKCRMCEDWPEDGVSRAWIRYAYAPPVSGMVRRMKYQGVYRMTERMGEDIADMILTDGDVACDIAVPVPMHPVRLRDRGANGPEWIAATIARRLGIPMADALRRTKNTRQQALLSAEKRRKLDIATFRAKDTVPLAGRRVLLVDDVITTGSTANACARALYAAGAKDVRAAAFAGHADFTRLKELEREPL